MIERWALGIGMALLVGGAATAGAQTTSVAPAEQAKPAKAEKPKRVCRREISVGSIMPTSTCHTKDEWAAIDQANGNAAAAGRDVRGAAGGQFNNGGVR